MKLSKLIKSPRLSEEDYLINLYPEEQWEEGRNRVPESQAPHRPEPETSEAKLDLQRQKIEAAAFAAGRLTGRGEAEQDVNREIQSFQTLTQGWDEALDRFFSSMESTMVDLVLAMVEKIAGTESAIHPGIIRKSVQKVLQRHTEPGEMLTLHLHPEDHARIAPAEKVAPRNLKLIPDETIQRGGCLLETKFGLIDARLETQMEEMGKELRAQIEEGGEAGQLVQTVKQAQEVRTEGKVVNVVGTVIEASGPGVTVGEQCEIWSADRKQTTRAEVIGFRESRVLLMPLGDRRGIGPGSRVVARGQHFMVQVGQHLLGRVLNGLGRPIDGLGSLSGGEMVSIYAPPNNPMQRKKISEPLYTGVRAIDGLLTCGKGGRLGIFSGSGVGKSVLLGMMARHTLADINVIALIGERGREVREFVEQDLGEEGLRRSVVIAVTSDESPILRIHGAQLAASVAEYFAGQGKDVMFMMDSVTRFAMAHREIGLAIGEPPTTKGYTPSTFAALPKLLERSGIFGNRGSITGFYTVLVEGDDMDEPVADHVRSILDGHIVLSRALSSQNHFPAIDILQSVSRLSKQICSLEQSEWAGMIRDNMAVFQEAQDLVNIGAYARGSNPRIDRALGMVEKIRGFLKQSITEKARPDEIWNQMAGIAGQANQG